MGRMSDYHIEMMNEAQELHASWEEFLERLLVKSGFQVQQSYTRSDVQDHEEYEFYQGFPDFIAIDAQDHKVAIEFKIYRWKDDWKRHVNNALDHLRLLCTENKCDCGILILISDFGENPNDKENLNLPEYLKVWDVSWLRSLAHPDHDLLETLDELVNETWIGASRSAERVEDLRQPETPTQQGVELSRKLRATAPGQAGWSDFERLCEEALKFLLGDHITGWKKQNRTTDGLNRMDLIGRIKGEARTFWADLARDFRTRYVVFEAKNYEDPIKQGQILTTEKYLFTAALRSVALIIAREGAGESAHKAAQGALREQGKLIIVISMKQLCGLLEGFDMGDPPENELYSIMDQMLVEIGR